jgi:hypothetical protein
MRHGWLLFLVGCSSNAEPQVFENRGTVCLLPSSGDRLEVEVIMPTCAGSNCDRTRSASCSVERDGDQLLLQSRAVIDFLAGDCHPICGSTRVACSASDVAPGEYTVIHGEERATVTLELDQQTELFQTGISPRCQ